LKPALGVAEDLFSDSAAYQGFVTAALERIDSKFNARVRNALNHGFRVTYCVGELAEERAADQTNDVLDRQLTEGLKMIGSDGLVRVIIAYEPRWAIGTGKTPTTDDIAAAHDYIRWRAGNLGHPRHEELVIQYGGSMKPDNVAEIMAVQGVNGGLIGGAALVGEKFAKIVNYDRQQRQA